MRVRRLAGRVRQRVRVRVRVRRRRGRRRRLLRRDWLLVLRNKKQYQPGRFAYSKKNHVFSTCRKSVILYVFLKIRYLITMRK